MSSQKKDELQPEEKMRQMSRRSFLWGAVAVGSAWGGLRWLSTQRQEEGIPWPLRRSLETNEQLARDYYKRGRLAPTFSADQITKERVNGKLGLGDGFDPSTWKLHVKGLAAGGDRVLTLQEIKALPRIEMTTELKCIEGWSIIVSWAGARLVDFIKKYPPATASGEKIDIENKPEDLPEYVSFSTPDEEYYVGLERESALHPQTLLCYEMNGKPLTLDHGAPLRLVTPLKYGIKNIKRIGTISFTAKRPDDYWAERGYDWYAGH